jgi:HEAT repeat protein
VIYRCLGIEGCRELAVNVLSSAGTPESIEYLAACLDYDQLGEIALNATVRIAERHQTRPQPEYFMHHIPKLLGMMQSPNPDTKKAAIRAICWSRNFAAQQRLIDAVKDTDLQECAIEGILQLGRRAVPGIIDEIRNTAGPHRRLLVKTLDMLGEQPALLQFAGDADPVVRMEVALALGAVRIPRATQVLRALMYDPEEEVRIAACKSIEKQGRSR